MQLKKIIWKMVKWRYMKNRLGYNDEEIELFRNNPQNKEILSKAPYLMNKTIIAKVVESHGCNSQHKVGDQFYFDGFGNLLTEICPKRICIYALNAIVPQIFAVSPPFNRLLVELCFALGTCKPFEQNISTTGDRSYHLPVYYATGSNK